MVSGTLGALSKTAPSSGGSKIGERRSGRDSRVDRSKPPWRSWRTRSRAARAIRFVESYCRIPSGARAGELLKLHRFQKEALEELLASGVRTGGLQLPRGNAKSTLWAAVGLWAVCDHDDAPQVPLVAFNGKQADRTLLAPIRAMVRRSDELAARVVVYTSTSDRRVWSAWNNGDLVALPANEERLQGLNPTLALVDEAQTVEQAVFNAVLQGAGKRPESLVLAIGTPAPDAEQSALFTMREQVREHGRIAWVEHAAQAGCALDDRREWRRANPAIAAGLLYTDSWAQELALVPEHEFRMYRLGQWVDVVEASWLPAGAWDACPWTDVPPDGTDVIVAVAGTWKTSVAVVGATLDGALFLAWWAESATDDELAAVVEAAAERWHVLEVVFAPRTRANVARDLDYAGVPAVALPHRLELEVTSATEWRQAIIAGRVAHDHDPTLAAHVAASVAVATADGQIRLDRPRDGRPVDAAIAARYAWARAGELQTTAGGPSIY
jgi:phage terminase large subunit-like protein